MISQNLNDPAFRNFPATTIADHALQFPFHRAQAAQAFLDTVQVLACDGVHLFTRLFGLIRKRQQLANIVQTETQLPAVTDKDQPRGLIF